MPLIDTVKPEKAENQIKDTYDMLLNLAGEIPKSLELFSVSPGLLRLRRKLLEYYLSSNLNPSLLTFIRYLTSENCNSGACARFNAGLLKGNGMSDTDLETVQQNPENAPLGDKEKKLLAFVLNAVADPESTSQADIDELRKLGWNDQEIFEAAHQGADMVLVGNLMKIFHMR